MAWYGVAVADSLLSRVLVPDPLEDDLTRAASGFWALLSRFAPLSIRPLTCISHPYWDMSNCVADSFLSISIRLPGFPLDPSPVPMFDPPEDPSQSSSDGEDPAALLAQD